MKDRVKEIRKHFKKTQAEFGAEINVSKSSVQGYEYGESNLTDRTISDICRVYGVNETWLRTGDGEMFAPASREAEIAAITATLFREEDESVRFRLIKLLASATEEEIEIIEKIANMIANKEL